MLNPDAPLLSGDALRERFLALDTFLLAQQSLWREKPFIQQKLNWEAEYPELAVLQIPMLYLLRNPLLIGRSEHNSSQRLGLSLIPC